MTSVDEWKVIKNYDSKWNFDKSCLVVNSVPADGLTLLYTENLFIYERVYESNNYYNILDGLGLRI